MENCLKKTNYLEWPSKHLEWDFVFQSEEERNNTEPKFEVFCTQRKSMGILCIVNVTQIVSNSFSQQFCHWSHSCISHSEAGHLLWFFWLLWFLFIWNLISHRTGWSSSLFWLSDHRIQCGNVIYHRCYRTPNGREIKHLQAGLGLSFLQKTFLWCNFCCVKRQTICLRTFTVQRQKK